MQEKRNRQRLVLTRLAFAKMGEYARGGLLKNISASGAMLEFVYPTGRAEHTFIIGDRVEIEIEGFEVLQGKVMRIGETDIAVEFNTWGMDEDNLITQIMSAANRIPLTEEFRAPNA